MNDAPDTSATPPIADRDLVLNFESLGDNCEFGLVQRKVGAEPLGLFRFTGAALRDVVRAMHARFAGLADPEQVRVQAENGEYMIKLDKYGFLYHADVKVSDADPDVLHRQHTRTARFLMDKLIADLESPEKIMVFRQNEPLLASDLVDLRAALRRFGQATLLWVMPACPGHPPGSVDVIDPNFMVGYVRRMASRETVPDLDVESWLTVLRRAYALWPARVSPEAQSSLPAEPLAPPARVDAVFGAAGNATEMMGFGWSKPENGYTWSIEARSQLTLQPPPEASDYWLEMDVTPYVVPPAVPHQSLIVSVNGTEVHRFDPLVRGMVGCTVPGALVRGRDTVEIVLDHPNAISPLKAAGEQDDRPLAIAFRTLSLVCAQTG